MIRAALAAEGPADEHLHWKRSASPDERPRMVAIARAGRGRCTARSKRRSDPRQALVRLLPYLSPFRLALSWRDRPVWSSTPCWGWSGPT